MILPDLEPDTGGLETSMILLAILSGLSAMLLFNAYRLLMKPDVVYHILGAICAAAGVGCVLTAATWLILPGSTDWQCVLVECGESGVWD